MKLEIVASENKTNTSECWNNYSGDAVAEFIMNHRPRFVDVFDGDRPYCWLVNSEDTMVFQVDERPTWEFVDDIRELSSDTFDVEHINGMHICRLWWD